MKKINYVSLCAILGFIFTFIALFARVQSVSSERDLDNKIIKSHFVVVMFYRKGKEEKSDRELRSKLERLESTYDALSTKTRYKDAGRHRDAVVAFVKINLLKDDLEQLAQSYGVGDLPAFILFENGKQVVDNEGKLVILKGFATRADLTNFIEANIGQEIDEYLREREEERARRREEDAYYRAIYAPYYYYPYYDYPYYYGYPYYHRPGFGFGFHFGGGHHRRW